jgi:peptidoglycan L-alanyl-D-glutamate endopeptidase CwlK
VPRFGKRSKKQLSTCNKKLQEVFNEVIKTVDCSVLEGHRHQTRQDLLYKERKTKVKFPNGRHNALPSLAADVVPFPIDWDDRERFHLFAGFVLGTARHMGIILRWGGDWNRNWFVDDNKFDDFPHFELVLPSNNKQ